MQNDSRAIDRMGFGEKVIRKLNENIIYVSISGFGSVGPYVTQGYMIQSFKH